MCVLRPKTNKKERKCMMAPKCTKKDNQNNTQMRTWTHEHAHCLDEKKAPHNLKTNDGLAVSFLETTVYY